MVLKRLLDLSVSLAAVALLVPVFALVAIAVKTSSAGPVLHWSKRVGRHNRIFLMPKFRTMRVNAPQVATHLFEGPERWITPVGRFLRSTSLDELPQLWSVIVGHMSLVGPRPALFNQDDLVTSRTALGIHMLAPGVTGWAQVNGRDELPIPLKVQYDAEYARRMSLIFDLQILLRTIVQAIRSHGVSH